MDRPEKVSKKTKRKIVKHAILYHQFPSTIQRTLKLNADIQSVQQSLNDIQYITYVNKKQNMFIIDQHKKC